ncbi:MAG: HNH endonuclease [Leptospirales bacterium]|nr:HNH endonuclease [Leptospirales bacterium]
MKKDAYKFKAKDFYLLLEKQNYRCPISGRELTPENCMAAHKVPIRKGGEHRPENIYLVTDAVNQIKRQLTDDELLELCGDILTTLGGKNAKKVSVLHRKRKSTQS